MNWPVCKLQVCKFVLIEFAPPEWQNIFHIKSQKLFTFPNGYLLLFRLLSLQKKRHQLEEIKWTNMLHHLLGFTSLLSPLCQIELLSAVFKNTEKINLTSSFVSGHCIKNCTDCIADAIRDKCSQLLVRSIKWYLGKA